MQTGGALSSGVCAVLRGAASVLRGRASVLQGRALVLRGVRLSSGVESEIGMKPCVNELCYEIAPLPRFDVVESQYVFKIMVLSLEVDDVLTSNLKLRTSLKLLKSTSSMTAESLSSGVVLLSSGVGLLSSGVGRLSSGVA